MTITAIVLAAGQSSRFDDGNKLLARIGDAPLVRHVLKQVAASAVDDILLVVCGDGEDVTAAAGAGRWSVVRNQRAQDGLASSIRHGIAALPAGASGALVILADMPGVQTSLIDRIVSAFRDDGEKRITFPRNSDGQRGHPVLWPSAYFTRLLELSGDKGGKDLIEAAGDDTLSVPIDDDGALFDIDTRADLQCYRSVT